ncbi:hypothetical protein [Macrococcus sp. DPC7161]|uniref:hypothetical protein n=1 Tax=Macrococcus sp. DPC7161 TaxID=2507060 RepID=UPI00100A6935|nr:hypothetical protein [Macrococcus sp. DPC7161]RXK17354.1 hypothetical protein ER639_11095 [Macrococcus sp. DPC7161]
MSNIDKLVSYAQLKLGQFGQDYRENHEHDAVQEIQPKSYDVNGSTITVHYDAHDYTLNLEESGVSEVTEADAKAVVDRLNSFFG